MKRKNNLISFRFDDSNKKTLDKQFNKSKYINKAIAAYSNLEKQLPGVIIDFLIDNPDEIILSYMFNKSSSFNNDNNLTNDFIIEKDFSSQTILNLESSNEYSDEAVVDSETIKNLEGYL